MSSMYVDHQLNLSDESVSRLGEQVDANLRYQPQDSGWYVNLHGSKLLDADICYPASEYSLGFGVTFLKPYQREMSVH